MTTRVPVIRPVSDIKPHRFNVGFNLPSDTIAQFKVKGWLPFDWTAEREIIIESSSEIKRIMESNSDVKGGR